MAAGKIYTGGLFTFIAVGLVSGAAVFFGMGGGSIAEVLGSVMLSGAIVMILNILGLRFASKSAGLAGLAVSIALLSYGIYVMTTFNALVTKDLTWTMILGGSSIGIGGVGLFSSLGAISTTL
jgi:hypothetical protein